MHPHIYANGYYAHKRKLLVKVMMLRLQDALTIQQDIFHHELHGPTHNSTENILSYVMNQRLNA